MMLSKIVGTIPGIVTRKYTEQGTPLIGFTGTPKQIGRLFDEAQKEGYDSNGLTALGINNDGSLVHMVAFDTEPGQKIGQGKKTQIDEATLRGMHQTSYRYAHLIAAQENGVNVAVFQKGFKATDETGRAFGQIAKNLFIKGHVVGDESTHVVLLLAPKGEREVFACRYGSKGPLKRIELPKPLTTAEQRFTVVDRQIMLVALYGGHKLYGLTADQIAQSFTEGAEIRWTEIGWNKEVAIEDMSLGIDGRPTILVTGKHEGQTRAFPVTIRWGQKTTSKGTNIACTAMINLKVATDSPIPVPIVRVSATRKSFVAVDGNGGQVRLQVGALNELGESFVNLVTQASQGAYQPAA